MSDPVQGAQARAFTPAKLITFSVVGLLVGAGLCGSGLTNLNRQASVFFVVAGLVSLAVSILGLVGGLIWAIIRAILRSSEP